jgi:MoaA/NifB/PqqE/SkfB family radical SAM enzyme
LFIELSADCQLSCAYCPRPRVSHHLPYELFEKIVDEASLFGHRSFSLHLFGEPLLYPRIIDCIRTLKRRGHAVILTTNGLLLGELLGELRGLRIDKIIWSYKKEIKVPEDSK